MDDGEKQYKIDMLTYQVNEFESAELSVDFEDGEDEETYLNRIRSMRMTREKLVSAIENALLAFDADDVVSILDGARSNIAAAERFDSSLSTISERLDALISDAEDIESEIKEYKYDNLSEGSGYSLDEVEERLDLIHKLKRKYGSSIAEILEFGERARKELEDIELSDERVGDLRVRLRNAESVLIQRAEILSNTRKSAAKVIEEGVNAQLDFLEMKNAAFTCEITNIAPTRSGTDRVEFLISANKGDPMRPLTKIASGGELSRIMLAIKNVLASADTINTLIFDEIDTGVSGRAAGKIAQKLKEMSDGKQVIAVTHLPQLAALADNHFLIEKRSDAEKTYTSVTALDKEGRIDELARIIGGENVSHTVKDTARELLGYNK